MSPAEEECKLLYIEYLNMYKCTEYISTFFLTEIDNLIRNVYFLKDDALLFFVFFFTPKVEIFEVFR